MIEYITIALLITGAFVTFLTTLGMLRFPDIFCRLHALAKSLPFGINLMLIAAWIHLGHDNIGFKTFLAILFQAVSIPVAGHLMALIAFKKNLARWNYKSVAYHEGYIKPKTMEDSHE